MTPAEKAPEPGARKIQTAGVWLWYVPGDRTDLRQYASWPPEDLPIRLIHVWGTPDTRMTWEKAREDVGDWMADGGGEWIAGEFGEGSIVMGIGRGDYFEIEWY